MTLGVGLILLTGPAFALDDPSYGLIKKFDNGDHAQTAPVVADGFIYGGVNSSAHTYYSIDPSSDYAFATHSSYGANAGSTFSPIGYTGDRFYITFTGNPALPFPVCSSAPQACTGGISYATPGQSAESTLLGVGDVYQPTGAIAADASGRVYFTDTGDGAGAEGNGVIWTLDSGDNLTEFETFTAADTTQALLVVGDYLYGLGADGGSNSLGRLWRIKTDGSAALQTLHNFSAAQGQPGGDAVSRSALLEHDGYLYGTTADYGKTGTTRGAIFRIKPDGTEFEILHDFGSDIEEGYHPTGPLAVDDDNHLYGTTLSGGTGNVGVLYRIDIDNIGTANPVFETLLDFADTTGKTPIGLTYDAGTDALYGTTSDTTDSSVFYQLAQGVPFTVDLSSERSSTYIGATTGDLELDWSVSGAPADTICTASQTSTTETTWAGELTLQAMDGDALGRKKGSGSVTIERSLNLVEGENVFKLTCESASQVITKTADATVTASVVPPLEVSVSLNDIASAQRFNLGWSFPNNSNLASFNDSLECEVSSTPDILSDDAINGLEDTETRFVPYPDNATGTVEYRVDIDCVRTLNAIETRATASTELEKVFSVDNDDLDNAVDASDAGSFSLWSLLSLGVLVLFRRRAERV
ncbi:hypothetical protein BGP77_02550 [Saccharospirillum sp. MSK14-1]|uniref:choice-of-anchor tandem repeat GloVer-containing protein n=1 Tax=Saccharospirillum sp. MSK14-1 TaxID=1897632 RepID=UPI000D4985B4|nr:choice-of-anchor tandem repeat GloVer-containing protein [Saccharospirillum sp. MSK14-1]PTY36211.1 hypothetical protein BGP77_02550 [Saccharospirillum sp. MSK14-1]